MITDLAFLQANHLPYFCSGQSANLLSWWLRQRRRGHNLLEVVPYIPLHAPEPREHHLYRCLASTISILTNIYTIKQNACKKPCWRPRMTLLPAAAPPSDPVYLHPVPPQVIIH